MGATQIRLDETEHGWVATDPLRNISSTPCESREAALADLDENLALADGDRTLSRETERALDATDGEYERGETTSLDALR